MLAIGELPDLRDRHVDAEPGGELPRVELVARCGEDDGHLPMVPDRAEVPTGDAISAGRRDPGPGHSAFSGVTRSRIGMTFLLVTICMCSYCERM